MSSCKFTAMAWNGSSVGYEMCTKNSSDCCLYHHDSICNRFLLWLLRYGVIGVYLEHCLRDARIYLGLHLSSNEMNTNMLQVYIIGNT